jgi:type I restriction enzyme S subunit
VTLIKLKEISTKIGSGATPKGGKEAYKSKGISLIRSMNVYDSQFKEKDLAFIDNSQAKKLSNVVVEPLDILLNITGASVARCCLVPEKILPARVNQHVAIIRIDKNLADPRFIYMCMISQKYKSKLLSLAQGGATREALTKITIEEFELELPQSITQTFIADSYLAYDNLIENNNRRIAILEDMAQSLYREWFVNFRYPGHADAADKYGNQKLIDSPLGKIPEGWEVKVFSESFDFWNGKKCAKSEQGEFDLYGANGIVGKSEDWKYENAVIIGRVGAYCGAVEYCFDRFLGSENTINSKCKTDTNISYLFLLLEHFNLNKYAGGSAQPLLTQTTLKQLKYIAPPEELINKFAKITHKFYEGVVNLKKRNENLKQQRDMLLPKLISGTIEL